jgi:hypothetical protein
MNKIISITLLLSLLNIITSCNKDENTQQDLKNTQISIIKPTENLMLVYGDTLQIDAIITSDVSMHGYEIIIHDLSSKTQQSILASHTHGKQISIKKEWVTPSLSLGEMEIEVIAIIDHTGLKTSTRRKFTVK